MLKFKKVPSIFDDALYSIKPNIWNDPNFMSGYPDATPEEARAYYGYTETPESTSLAEKPKSQGAIVQANDSIQSNMVKPQSSTGVNNSGMRGGVAQNRDSILNSPLKMEAEPQVSQTHFWDRDFFATGQWYKPTFRQDSTQMSPYSQAETSYFPKNTSNRKQEFLDRIRRPMAQGINEDSLQNNQRNNTFTSGNDPYVFDSIIPKVFQVEGGFVNDPDDSGKATNHGIAWKTWESTAMPYLGKEPTLENLKSLTKEEATKIYREAIWNPSRAENIGDGKLRHLYFDFVVNSGRGAAVKKLQQAINQTGGDVTVDGGIGPKTLEAVNSHNSLDSLYQQYKQNRIDLYDEIVRKKPNQQKFYKGWMNRMKNF